MSNPSIILTNLTAGQLSIDITLDDDRIIRATLSAGASKDIGADATLDELNRNPQLAALLNAGRVSITAAPAASPSVLGGVDDDLMVVFDAAVDATGGATTTTVGFQLKYTTGGAAALSRLIEFAVFDDATFATPASNATLNTAAEGTIVGGAGTAALKVLTDASGRFSCTLSDASDETVYLACSPTFGSPIVDCRASEDVVFSA